MGLCLLQGILFLPYNNQVDHKKDRADALGNANADLHSGIADFLHYAPVC